jgi:tripartite-type tricarboxylate transporter receptor subunit TctC
MDLYKLEQIHWEGPSMNYARVIALLLLAGWALIVDAAQAQTYPTKPITLICPFPPGGATDTISRVIQDSMSKTLGQQVVIENIGGAGGMIAAAKAARAAPDGYTIMIHQVALAAGVSMYKNLSFDAVKDFVAIGLINNATSTLAARATMPPANITELIKWMKDPANNTKIGHPGVGSFGHLATVLVAQEIGAKVTQIPYRGAGPALNDLLAGQVDLESQSAVVAGPLVKSGKIKAYAIIGRNRYAGLPDLPTMGEIGYKKLDIDFWHALFAPAGTPQPIIDKLNAALREALSDAKVVKIFTDGGMDIYKPDQLTPAAATAMLKSEIKLWGDVIRANNITAQ